MRTSVLALLGAILFTCLCTPAHGMCLTQQEAGRWKNADSATRGLTRIELVFNCQDQILNGEPYPPGPPWKMHVFGSCEPSDCDWGMADGRRLDTGHVFARYKHGYATRYVFARMSQYRKGQLWVYMWTDFTSADGRTDYPLHGWFVRETP